MSEWRGLLLPHDALRARVLYHLIMPLVALNQTRSQAVARIADRTASQQTLVITDALP